MTFTTFVAGTKAKAAEVNENFIIVGTKNIWNTQSYKNINTNSESYTTTTVQVSFTPSALKNCLVHAYVGMYSGASDGWVTTQIDGVNYDEAESGTRGSIDNPDTYNNFRIMSFSASTHTVKLMYKTNNSSYKIYLGGLCGIIITELPDYTTVTTT